MAETTDPAPGSYADEDVQVARTAIGCHPRTVERMCDPGPVQECGRHADLWPCQTGARMARRVLDAVAPTIQAAALRDLARVCFDEGDAGVIVGGIEVVETYVYDTIAALTGDERDQRNADLMREIAGRLMAEKLGRS